MFWINISIRIIDARTGSERWNGENIIWSRNFYSPLHSPVIDGMPKGSGGQNVGCAGLSYELDEINTRIDEKIQELRKEYVKITDILEFLNDGSTERAILEYKYIDGLSWKGICDQEHLSKTPATQYWRKGFIPASGICKGSGACSGIRKRD